MSLFTTVFVYLLIWWVTLFMVLPWGVRRSPEEDLTPNDGIERGAPQKAMMGKKIIANSLLAAVVTALIWVAFDQDWVSLRRIAGQE